MAGLAACSVAVLPAAAHAATDAVPNQAIVGFKADTGHARALKLLDGARARIVRDLRGVHAFAVRPKGHRALSTVLRALRRHSRVRYTEPDVYLRTSKTPDDPLFSRQYGLGGGAGGVAATSAWDHRTGCGRVAVLDTGMQLDHPDLTGNIWHNPDEIKGNKKDDDHNGYVDDYYGVDIYDGSGGGADADGHGTHVSGIVAGHGNNALGVAGVCWSASVMPIRFMNANGRGSTSNAVAGIEYAIHEHAKVVNCSFGASSASNALHDAVEDAKKKGVLLVVAAGNDGQSIDKTPEYPASFTFANILTVAATTASGTLASFSNFGSKSVDLAAPGDDVWSTYLGSGYKQLSGTSMAAPFVTAAAAMLRKQDSDLSYGDVKKAIKGSVDRLSALKGKTVTGGRLDLARALEQVG
jgi:subtilisin family serine protease